MKNEDFLALCLWQHDIGMKTLSIHLKTVYPYLNIYLYISILHNMNRIHITYTSTYWRSYYTSMICMKKKVSDNNGDNMFTKWAGQSDKPRAQAKHSNYHPKKSWIHTRKFSDRSVHFSKWFNATSEAKPQGYAQTSQTFTTTMWLTPLSVDAGQKLDEGWMWEILYQRR